nr:MAG TPA: hypothetical protein [Caudoviricetes sp.]
MESLCRRSRKCLAKSYTYIVFAVDSVTLLG